VVIGWSMGAMLALQAAAESESVAAVVVINGTLRFASDDKSYVSWALERFMAHDAFEWTASSPDDWCMRPDDWFKTRYEAKALKAGRACAYLSLGRR